MAFGDLRVDKAAEDRLRAVISKEFRGVVSKYGSELAAATAIGISRQRLKKYLDKKMTPKADVLLVAMARWNIKIVHEGISFSARVRRKKEVSVQSEQLSLNYFDEPQVLHDDQGNVEIRVSRKQSDTLKLAVEVRLAG
jgi:hypothetical protein